MLTRGTPTVNDGCLGALPHRGSLTGPLLLSESGCSLSEAEKPHLFSSARSAISRPQLAIVVVDAPSDQKDMDQAFRMSARHSTDMTAVAHEIRKRFPNARLVIMGHSRGTISAGYVSRALGNEVSAVVLFSGIYAATQPSPQIRAPGPGLSELDLGSLKSPVLIVHHAKDGCPAA